MPVTSHAHGGVRLSLPRSGTPPMVSHGSGVSPRPGDAVRFRAVSSAGGSLVLAAPAKLNLFLEVRGKRPDGYHELETLMVAVDLFDTLELSPRTDGVLALECDPPGLPTGPENLVYQAAERLRARANRPALG